MISAKSRAEAEFFLFSLFIMKDQYNLGTGLNLGVGLLVSQKSNIYISECPWCGAMLSVKAYIYLRTFII